mgnify:CR=1 FL=1
MHYETCAFHKFWKWVIDKLAPLLFVRFDELLPLPVDHFEDSFSENMSKLQQISFFFNAFKTWKLDSPITIKNNNGICSSQVQAKPASPSLTWCKLYLSFDNELNEMILYARIFKVE